MDQTLCPSHDLSLYGCASPQLTDTYTRFVTGSQNTTGRPNILFVEEDGEYVS